MTSPLALGSSDIPEGESRGYEAGEEYLLVSRVAGALHAIDDVCGHAGCLLSGGRREGRAIVCPCHEVAFDVTDGRNLTDRVMCGDQRVLAVKEEGGQLFFLPGPPARADGGR